MACTMSFCTEREEVDAPSPKPCCEPDCDKSKHDLHKTSDEAVTAESVTGQNVASPEPSYVSLKSSRSVEHPPNLNDEAQSTITRTGQNVASPEPSCVSLKSNRSVEHPPNLNDEAQSTIAYKEEDELLQRVKERHKTTMKEKYESLFEGTKLQENQTLLSRIYTQVYIIEGENEGVNEEHEVLHMEKKNKTQHLQDTPINCNDIFDLYLEPEYKTKKRKRKEEIKTVLTKGIAGIGKTVSVQKFILDWVEGKANQDVDFMFVFQFRKLNLVKDQKYSLHRLLLDFHPELQDLDSKIYEECKVVFIFDGLDESRISLMFSDKKKVSDMTATSSVGVLMTNLITGNLLPSALIWITSRPAAANQIPSKYINRLTEIQGFTDPQKEEYFRKRISDQQQASKIISHIRGARSLHIMCHIPVFCWISSTVLQKILKQDQTARIPKSLTEMYIHFLLIQINVRNKKYDEINPEKLLSTNREVIVKLAELAFKQLMKGNVIFYEEDLIESSIDVTDASVYSGICTEIIKKESVIYQKKVYCFVHLSFQEFLAAFYVFYIYISSNTETLFDSLHDLHKRVVKKALMSESGGMDLLLRFLMGISLESSQMLLQGLLTRTEKTSETISKTTQYIKNQIISEKNISAERSINLFLCLLEVNDQTLFREIQEFLKSKTHSENSLSASHCSAITYMLQISERVLDELDLKKYNTTEKGRRRLIPAVINCQKALLAGCNLTDQSCEIVISALKSSDSPLRELDLSNNDLQDSGVKRLSDGLKNPNCCLEILRLSGCMVTEEGCRYLALALNSNPSHLSELDLSYNHPGDSGVKLLSEKLEDPNCKLKKLNLDHGNSIRIKLGLRKYACDLTFDVNTANSHLILSENNRKVTCVEKEQSYPDHPERFNYWHQVLSRESLTGRCYWEVECSGKRDCLSVTYKGISRKDARQDCYFGKNEKSWALNCLNYTYSVCHNDKETVLKVLSLPSNRIGVYLDSLAGTLSFYIVSDTHTLTHLHTFNTTFTEPVYVGLGTYESMSFVKL